MLQRIQKDRSSIAEAMILNFKKDEGLKQALQHLDNAIDLIERNRDHSEEVALLHIARLAVREKILLLAYD
jgi:hypothetical protein